jgi:hypothetical protein
MKSGGRKVSIDMRYKEKGENKKKNIPPLDPYIIQPTAV